MKRPFFLPYAITLGFILCLQGNLNGQAVVSFTLINAVTDQPLMSLEQGDTINLLETGSALNIRANTSGSIGSVRFWLNGEQRKTEGAAPYAMDGDNNGDYNIWSPGPGNYTVKATPYSGSGATGTAGTSLEVDFVVVEAYDPLVPPADAGSGEMSLSGQLKQWHRITLSFDGPAYREIDNDPNPFLDYNLQVTFTNGSRTYVVPGYFAADGIAGESSADSGNVWRVHFAPDTTGTWTWLASFALGRNLAVIETAPDRMALAPLDGAGGTFEVLPSDKTGRDNRAAGRLNYVGEHFLQYEQSGEYFLKGGADAPENFLAYEGFDGDFKSDGQGDGLIKSWSGHIGDWNTGDPVWKGDRGKGIIGAVNYLASEGLNAFSFLTMNIGGDDKNVFPYVNSADLTHFDCSRLDQWEVVFSHADSLGMFLHFKTQETENDQLLDGGEVGIKRKLYYRELIARFGHHLALNWNLGEENSQTDAQRKAMARFFHDHDPYRHPVVIHTFPGQVDQVYAQLVGEQSLLTGVSIQTDWNRVHEVSRTWVQNSAVSGRKWVVANDEQGSAKIGVPEDAYTGTPDRHDIRREVLWGNLMAGGAGVEYYFGYDRPHSDLNCEDFRSRDISWDYVRYALDFFREHTEFWKMRSLDDLVPEGWCLGTEGQNYVVYLPSGGNATLDLKDTLAYSVRWYNPRQGGGLRMGSDTLVSGKGPVSLGAPPDSEGEDWVVLVKRDHGVNIPPRAVIRADTLNGTAPLTIRFDGSASTDDDTIVHWFWDFGDGDTLSGRVLDHSYEEAGTFKVCLVVTDRTGAIGVACETVEVSGEIPSPCGEYLELFARDFPYQGSGFYLDTYTDYELLAIQPGSDPVTASVSTGFPGASCLYDLVFHGIGESDGASSFRIYAGDRLLGSATMPLSTQGWEEGEDYNLLVENVSLFTGDEIRVEGTTASADGAEWSRARWLKIEFIPGDFIPDYLEEQGMVIIEAESLSLKESWNTSTSRSSYTGEGYIYWNGSEYFNNTSHGRISTRVHISHPGIYRFEWRVGIGYGSSGTEHNDTWLKIEADDFYGYRTNGDSYVHPKPLCQEPGSYDCPNGSSLDGYFKIYGGPLNGWIWKAVTSDNEDHNIYAKFDREGVYSIHIAARSSHHCIDRMVIYHVGMVSETAARNLGHAETVNPVFTPVEPVSSGIQTQGDHLHFSLYPNPANSRVYFKGVERAESIRLMDMAGRILDSLDGSEAKSGMDVSFLEKGMYLVVMGRQDGSLQSRKLLIEN